MLDSMCLAKNKDVVSQRVKDQTVLFHLDRGDYFALNAVGAQAWDLLDGKRTVADISAQLSEEYDAPAEVIASDVHSLFENLTKAGLLVGQTSEL